MLLPRALRHIPNGVDLAVFRPDDRGKARAVLNLPAHTCILLFAAVSARGNPFKDYATIEQAICTVAREASTRTQVMFLALGSEQAGEARLGDALVRHIPFERDQARVARYYQASDIYLHVVKANTSLTTFLEALACGRPIVATAVGGIPEQIQDGRTGFLVAPADATAMASRIRHLLDDYVLRKAMGIRAAAEARSRFDLARQVDAYLAWYAEILEDFREQDRT